jgi:hypothetical protein
MYPLARLHAYISQESPLCGDHAEEAFPSQFKPLCQSSAAAQHRDCTLHIEVVKHCVGQGIYHRKSYGIHAKRASTIFIYYHNIITAICGANRLGPGEHP